jgi:hypothetical protein
MTEGRVPMDGCMRRRSPNTTRMSIPSRRLPDSSAADVPGFRHLNRQGEEAVHPEDEHDDRQTQDHVPHPHALEARGNPTEEQH